MTERQRTAQTHRQKFLGDIPPALEATDPEYAAMRDRLIYGEIAAQGVLTDEQRALVTLVTLTAGQALGEIVDATEAALNVGVTPVAIKEAVYQCAPYAGFSRTTEALRLVNAVFAKHNIALPLEKQATVSEKSRFADGLAVQKRIFDEAIDTMHAKAAEQQKTLLVQHLSAFCFGDIYTRTGLDLKMRELLTFAIVSTLGGCEPQVKAHVQGNAAVGNSKQLLVDALTHMLPYIGFPRTLNALGCVNAVLQDS